MFRFEHVELLWFLCVIPVIILIFIISRQIINRRLSEYGDSHLVDGLMVDKSRFKPIFKLSIILFALALLIIGAANPQIGSKPEKIKRQGIELIVALDISNSMNAQDLKPSRLERAKQSMMKLIDNLQGDRIGIVVFAGDGFLLLPITSDYSAAKLLVSTVETNLINTQGTAIGNAIDLAMGAFSDKEGTSRALIMITDGENHEDDAVSAAKTAADNGVKIYTIGMGTPDGAPIPIIDRYGRARGFQKDQMGQAVMTKLNPAILKQIANRGNGYFTYASGTGTDLTKILNDIAGMDKEEFEEQIYTAFDDKFMYFIALAIILLIIDSMISNRKNKYLDMINNFASGGKGGKK